MRIAPTTFEGFEEKGCSPPDEEEDQYAIEFRFHP
jgi:hypothetical protein